MLHLSIVSRETLGGQGRGFVMKKILVMTILGIMLLLGGNAESCVGKVLHIGILDSAAEQIIAEIVANLVTERTGTSVKIVTFKNAKDVYAAAQKGEIGLVVESRDRAFDIIGKPHDSNPKSAQETLRREYQKSFNMVWLDSSGGNSSYAPVLSSETVSSLPALPKLLNKLSGVLTDDACKKLVKSAKSDEKPKKIARDFLKAKRLI